MSSVRDILSRPGREALQSLRGHHVLFAFDFDGTLAPLVRHPSLVRIPTPVRRQIFTLAGLAPVVIISGRSLADLRSFFPGFPGFLVGNHGSEGWSGNRSVLRSARQTCNVWRSYLHRLLRTRDDIWLEDKVFTLTVHSHSPAVLRSFKQYFTADVLRSLPPIRFLPGKASVNLLPSSVPSKGEAMGLLLRKTRAERGFFIGDDETDEDAFSAAGRHVLTVRVGRVRRTHAGFLLGNQKQVGQLLTVLIGLCRPS